jgi:hypothetical protein
LFFDNIRTGVCTYVHIVAQVRLCQFGNSFVLRTGLRASFLNKKLYSRTSRSPT